MADVTLTINVNTAALEERIAAVMGTAGVGRSCDELEQLYRFLRGALPYTEAARAFSDQLTGIERARVKGHIRVNKVFRGMANALQLNAMSMCPRDTGALKASIIGRQ